MGGDERHLLLFQATYLDADCSKDVPGQLRKVGLQDVVCWAVQEGESLVVPPPPTGSAASSCSRAFFRALRGLRGSLVREAYSLAMVAMENYPLAPENSGAMIGPSLVSIRSASFPDHTTVPVPLPGSCPVDVSGGISVAVPEWRDIRLIAPRTEVRGLCPSRFLFIRLVGEGFASGRRGMGN